MTILLKCFDRHVIWVLLNGSMAKGLIQTSTLDAFALTSSQTTMADCTLHDLWGSDDFKINDDVAAARIVKSNLIIRTNIYNVKGEIGLPVETFILCVCVGVHV